MRPNAETYATIAYVSFCAYLALGLVGDQRPDRVSQVDVLEASE